MTTHTLLLTDVIGSTDLANTLGDAVMAELWSAHDRMARDLLRTWRGREIDRSDGFLLLFDQTDDAVGYALAYHRGLTALPHPLRARAGIHVGPLQLRANPQDDIALGAKPLEVEGLAKSVAARIMAIAQGGQSLLSAEAKAALGETGHTPVSHGHWRLKGIDEPLELFEVGDVDAPFLPPPDSDKAYRVVLKNGAWLPVREVPHNLPQATTSFLGREEELRQIFRKLEDTRLLTLLGTGGLGKTRLALEAGGNRLGEHPDGVWFVDLAALTDPSLVAGETARALGLIGESGQDAQRTLVAHLKSRRALLILDNCEHLIEACAALAHALLRATTQLTILATSREALRIPGEALLPLSPLAVTAHAGADSLAALLFIERARASHPGLNPDDAERELIARIVTSLDGIPLAIELAAARLPAISLPELLNRLDQRLGLLTKGARSAPRRQQTLRALIEWSYDLLTPAERTLFTRLAVFAGGSTREATEAVCTGGSLDSSSILELLDALTDKSLLLAKHEGGATRWSMLDSVRAYANERLECDPDAAGFRLAQLHWCQALVDQARPHLGGRNQKLWLERLEKEHDNLRAALAWATSNPAKRIDGLRLAIGLAGFWLMRGHAAEGRQRLHDLRVNALDVPLTMLADALGAEGELACQQGDVGAAGTLLATAEQYCRQLDDRARLAVQLRRIGALQNLLGELEAACNSLVAAVAIHRELGQHDLLATALTLLGRVLENRGQPDAACAAQEEARALAHAYDLLSAEAAARHGLATAAQYRARFADARDQLTQAVALWRALGDTPSCVMALFNLARATAWSGDVSAARPLAEEGLALARQIGLQRGIAFGLAVLGDLASRLDDDVVAQDYFRQSLPLYVSLGDRRQTAFVLANLGYIARALSEHATAVVLWGAAESIRTAIGNPFNASDQAAYEREKSIARDTLGADDFERLYQEGKQIPVEEILRWAGRAAQGTITIS